MPLYEYRCLSCNETFEIRQKFSDEPIAVHVACGGQGKRMLSAPQLHFKGSGFYITDYGKGGKDAIKPVGAKSESGKDGKESNTESKSESKSDNKSESKSENKSDGKSDTKSDTKKETKTESKPPATPAATKSE
jgi:putative FmdB family regulatory protein